MSYFNFETEINDIIRLDAPIKNGPQPRWKRKAEEEISAKSSTPNKLVNRSTNKTPTRSPNKKTPGKQKTPKTPSGDRFIPNRNSMNMDTSYFKVMSKEETEQENEGSPSKAEFRKSMTENLCANELNAKILTYRNKAPVPREGKYFLSLCCLCCYCSTKMMR
jgi:cell division cycle protein 20 (cofactor of APC complex)